MINADAMINEFMEGLDLMKDKLLNHLKRAKEYGRSPHILAVAATSLEKAIKDGKMIGYEEIFGKRDAGSLYFEHDGDYFIYDHYCPNPECDCNQAVLDFYFYDAAGSKYKYDFTVRLKLGSLKYEMVRIDCSNEKINDILDYIIKNKPETIRILKRRYNDVKNAGKTIDKNLTATEAEKPVINTGIGRNDPCPCGSGKKYKKCCGRNADGG